MQESHGGEGSNQKKYAKDLALKEIFSNFHNNVWKLHFLCKVRELDNVNLELIEEFSKNSNNFNEEGLKEFIADLKLGDETLNKLVSSVNNSIIDDGSNFGRSSRRYAQNVDDSRAYLTDKDSYYERIEALLLKNERDIRFAGTFLKIVNEIFKDEDKDLSRKHLDRSLHFLIPKFDESEGNKQILSNLPEKLSKRDFLEYLVRFEIRGLDEESINRSIMKENQNKKLVLMENLKIDEFKFSAAMEFFNLICYYSKSDIISKKNLEDFFSEFKFDDKSEASEIAKAIKDETDELKFVSRLYKKANNQERYFRFLVDILQRKELVMKKISKDRKLSSAKKRKDDGNSLDESDRDKFTLSNKSEEESFDILLGRKKYVNLQSNISPIVNKAFSKSDSNLLTGLNRMRKPRTVEKKKKDKSSYESEFFLEKREEDKAVMLYSIIHEIQYENKDIKEKNHNLIRENEELRNQNFELHEEIKKKEAYVDILMNNLKEKDLYSEKFRREDFKSLQAKYDHLQIVIKNLEDKNTHLTLMNQVLQERTQKFKMQLNIQKPSGKKRPSSSSPFHKSTTITDENLLVDLEDNDFNFSSHNSTPRKEKAKEVQIMKLELSKLKNDFTRNLNELTAFKQENTELKNQLTQLSIENKLGEEKVKVMTESKNKLKSELESLRKSKGSGGKVIFEESPNIRNNFEGPKFEASTLMAFDRIEATPEKLGEVANLLTLTLEEVHKMKENTGKKEGDINIDELKFSQDQILSHLNKINEMYNQLRSVKKHLEDFGNMKSTHRSLGEDSGKPPTPMILKKESKREEELGEVNESKRLDFNDSMSYSSSPSKMPKDFKDVDLDFLKMVAKMINDYIDGLTEIPEGNVIQDFLDMTHTSHIGDMMKWKTENREIRNQFNKLNLDLREARIERDSLKEKISEYEEKIKAFEEIKIEPKPLVIPEMRIESARSSYGKLELHEENQALDMAKVSSIINDQDFKGLENFYEELSKIKAEKEKLEKEVLSLKAKAAQEETQMIKRQEVESRVFREHIQSEEARIVEGMRHISDIMDKFKLKVQRIKEGLTDIQEANNVQRETVRANLDEHFSLAVEEKCQDYTDRQLEGVKVLFQKFEIQITDEFFTIGEEIQQLNSKLDHLQHENQEYKREAEQARGESQNVMNMLNKIYNEQKVNNASLSTFHSERKRQDFGNPMYETVITENYFSGREEPEIIANDWEIDKSKELAVCLDNFKYIILDILHWVTDEIKKVEEASILMERHDSESVQAKIKRSVEDIDRIQTFAENQFERHGGSIKLDDLIQIIEACRPIVRDCYSNHDEVSSIHLDIYRHLKQKQKKIKIFQ